MRNKSNTQPRILKAASRIFFYVFCFVILGISADAQFIRLIKSGKNLASSDEWITQSAFFSTGKKFVTSDVDGNIAIRDAENGQAIKEISLGTSVLTLSLSKDGLLLAAGDASGSVSLIETETGKILKTFKADKNIVNASALSDDGKFVAAGGNDGIVRMWSVSDDKIIEEINPGQGNIVALNFVDSSLVVGAINFKESKGLIEVWDWRNKKVLRRFDEGTPALRGIAVSPDGKMLAVANFRPSSLLTILPAVGKSFSANLHLLPDSDDATPVAIWDLTTGKQIALIDAELGARSVAFSQNGRMLACAGANGTMIYDIADRTFAEIGRVDSRTAVDAIDFSSDSQQLIIACARQSLVKAAEGGLDKLFDPFFINLAMVVREGAAPTFTKKADAQSLTGGSDVEIWQINSLTAPPDVQTWEAVRAGFDNKPDEARRILQQVIKDFPKYGEARRLNAVLFETDDFKKLQGLLESAVNVDPDCISCLRTLGDIQYKTGQILAATNTYERVLQLKPEYGLITGRLAETYGGLALTMISAGNNKEDMEAAAKGLNKALTLRPGEARFYTNLGSVYYFRGDFDKDIELLLIAQKLRPDHARVYYNLGHAYRFKDDKQKSLEAYRRYVEMGETGEEERVERAKQYIKQLDK